MSFQEWVKFLTTEFVRFVNTPQSERRQQKQVRKVQRGGWSQHWFGVVPTALMMMMKSARIRRRGVFEDKADQY